MGDERGQAMRNVVASGVKQVRSSARALRSLGANL